MTGYVVCASEVLSTKDLKAHPDQELCEIVARFLAVSEGLVAHWVEYARGVLLFVMAPGDDRSGEFYIYDRKKGVFWLLDLVDGIYGGYSVGQMRQKMRDFRLLELAENPSRLKGFTQVRKVVWSFSETGVRNSYGGSAESVA
jgi:hypothetical protein